MTAKKPYPYASVMGLEVIQPSKDEKRGHVTDSRHVRMPDGTVTVCRRRTLPDGSHEWTAEVPLEVVKEVYADD